MPELEGHRRPDDLLLQKIPTLNALVPVWLDRGDPTATELALRQAIRTQRSELRDFAFSQRGCDRLRIQAAYAACDARLIPPEPVRMWVDGRWSEMLVLAFTANWEVGEKLPGKAKKLGDQGLSALQAGQFGRAESLLLKALDLAPDSPGLANNLASVYSQTDREDRALELVEKIHQRHPDYVFAITALARVCIFDRDFDAARALLRPALERRSVHVSEFAAICQCQLLLAKYEKSKSGKLWEDLWWQMEDQDPEAARFRPTLLD
jgi:tetratricopeptide (TPR) repeat protein